MTKPTIKTCTPGKPCSTVILFGVDEHDRPRAARFTGHGTDLLSKAAAAMNLKLYEATTADALEAAKKLPRGRLYSNGRGFVPYVRRDLYAKVVAVFDQAAGPATGATKAGATGVHPLPRNWQEIAPGHLVIMQESVEDGWWEAIVVARVGDILTLKFRDFTDYDEFQRHVGTIALMHPSAGTADA